MLRRIGPIYLHKPTEMKTTYRDEQYEVLDLDDAVAEFDYQKAKGVHKAVIAVPEGYIVVDAVFPEEEQQDEKESP